MSATARLLTPALLGLLALAAAAPAQTLYGIAYSGNDGLSTLHTIDPGTAAATLVGAVGFERCGGMDFDAAGTLFATCERSDGSDTPVLITVDTATGAGTEVGPTGFSGAIGDISFRPSDGVLFAYDATNDPDHSLITIDTNTGAGTLVGNTGLSFAGGNGMAFDTAGTLYQSQFTGGPAPDLNTLNPANGAPTLVGQISPLTGRFTAFDTHPVSGIIYGIVNDGSSGGGPNSLATLDPSGPSATVIGVSVNGLDAIAFAPEIQGPNAVEIPTVDGIGLAALMAALAALGAWLMRRGRSAVAG